MGHDREHRRLRIVIDIERRPPTDDEVGRTQRNIANTPNAIPNSCRSAWLLSLSLTGPEEFMTEWAVVGDYDEQLPAILSTIRHLVPAEAALTLTDSQAPVDPRYAELIASGPLPNRTEVAEKTAALLGLDQPRGKAGEDVLVDMVLVARRWYDDHRAVTDATNVGHGIVSRLQGLRTQETFSQALAELGVEDDVQLWNTAANLIRRMGFRVS